MAALTLYVERDEEGELERQRQRSERLRRLLGTIPGGTVALTPDETRPIYRVQLSLGDEAPMSAADLVRALEGGTPSIRTRNHHVAQGRILFDPRTLRDGEEVVVAQHVRSALGLEGS
jgi:seryl-tRNA(Sec) selenium transferase